MSNAQNMYRMFNSASAFNIDISGWVRTAKSLYLRWLAFGSHMPILCLLQNVGEVTRMGGTFAGSGFNINIGSWDVSKVSVMNFMFSNSAFNQDLSAWDNKVSSVALMRSMFQDNTAFNQDLSGWDVTSVTTIQDMFNGATSFNQNLCGWNSKLDNATTVTGAFDNTDCPSSDAPDFALTPPGPFCFVCVPPPTR